MWIKCFKKVVNQVIGAACAFQVLSRARARARMVTVEDRYDIRTLYREAVGYEMQPFVEKMCCDYILQGMEKEVVMHAIELTGWAPRPRSWRKKTRGC